ncbi:MAG: hypothetical protein IJA75_03070 [Oscillospiraceae bacterium]|nr:hypothetical protein [Oscillospiraceae bacterium]
MMKKLWLDGKSSRDFGLAITGAGTYDAPERDLEFVSIEGRNGDLVFDRGRYKNIIVEYPASICRKFGDYERPLKEWLYGSHDYRRLEDDYSPDTYRLGVFRGPLNFDVLPLARAAELTLRFECKPQRWLKSGEKLIVLENTGVEHGAFVNNPTPFPALPIIVVNGNGAGTLSWTDENRVERTLEILDMEYFLTLDCELMEAFRGSENKNGSIKAPVFPVIPGGGTRFKTTGGITSLEIVPRWWTL